MTRSKIKSTTTTKDKFHFKKIKQMQVSKSEGKTKLTITIYPLGTQQSLIRVDSVPSSKPLPSLPLLILAKKAPLSYTFY